MQSILSVGITTTKSLINYLTCKTKNDRRSVDAHVLNRAGSVSLSVLPVKAASLSFMNVCNQSPSRLTMKQGQTLVMLRWRSFSECGRERVAFSFGFKWGLYHIYESPYPLATQITQDARRRIIDVLSTPIGMMGHGACLSCFWL